MEKNNIPFNLFYKKFNYLSLSLIFVSILFLLFKGLNYGVDFKGGTLIELRTNDNTIRISDLRKYSDIKIYELTNISINETLSRTLITSITTLLALLSIFFFGGEILKGFSLAMIFGVVFGTYSSIYIANTVLVGLKVSQRTILREDDKN